MAVPAHLTSLSLLLHVTHTARLYKLLIQLGVAAYAVVHHHLSCQRLGHWGLSLGMGHKIGRVLQSVHRLETIFQGEVLVGHMAVVTRGVSSVRGMAPRGIVRCHDVAVDAGRRVIAHEIGMRPEQIHKQSAKTTYNASHNQQAHLLTIGEPVFKG